MTCHTVTFQKWHGLGNDFIIPDRTHEHLFPLLQSSAVHLCDRRKGIGADGLLFLLPSEIADFKMVIINSDGSEAEMCGNGIRCLASYIGRQIFSLQKNLAIETGAGIIKTELLDDTTITVNMGSPRLDASEIPVAGKSGVVLMQRIDVGDREFKFTSVSMGNPHTVIYADLIDDNLVKTIGPQIETNPMFPKKTNVEFITILSDSEILMRVWERGCGETQACGTGACASAVSGILNKLHGNNVTVHLPGGDLLINWSGILSDPVYMTGPAMYVFDGKFEVHQ